MIALCAAVASVGFIPGLIFLLLAAVLSGFGIYILSACSRMIGTRNASFLTLSQATYPKAALLFDGALVVKCFGVASAYLMTVGKTMGQTVTPLFEENSIFTRKNTWVLLFGSILVPLAFLRKFDSLRYTSMIGLFGIFYLVALAVVMFFANPNPNSIPEDQQWEWISTFELSDLSNFGSFIFAFTCHQNIFPVHNEARNNSAPKMKLLITLCIGTATAVYFCFAFSEYVRFGRNIQGNVLLEYPDQPGQPFYGFYLVARLFFVFLLTCSIPLQFFPLRQAVQNVISLVPGGIKFHQKQGGVLSHVCITSGMLVLVFTTALIADDLKKMTNSIGSTASLLICYILPFIFYYKLTIKDGWTFTRLCSAALCVFGCLSMPLFIFIFFKYKL